MMEEEKTAISLAKIAKDILIPNSGYLSRLLVCLDNLVMKIEREQGEKFDLARAVFLAEFANYELDNYMNEFSGKGISGLDDFYASEKFETRWSQLKSYRDGIYARLVNLQQKIGKSQVGKELVDFSVAITRFAFPG